MAALASRQLTAVLLVLVGAVSGRRSVTPGARIDDAAILNVVRRQAVGAR